tara:strand:+ start:567 stop:791 length:225 start_codon:yes stop_codon:yes gene_type:complete
MFTRAIFSTRKLTKRRFTAGLLAHASMLKLPSQISFSGIIALTQRLQLRGQLWIIILDELPNSHFKLEENFKAP